MFGDMQGVEVIAEATEEEHDRLLRNVQCQGQENKMCSCIPKRSSFSSNELSVLGPSYVKMESVLISLKSMPWWNCHNQQVK